jgi:hypothetical protein
VILHFKTTTELAGGAGVHVIERQCLEHPRLRHLQQCLLRDTELGLQLVRSDTFRVAGIAGAFDDMRGALDALRLNPLPSDLVAVPPWEIPG